VQANEIDEARKNTNKQDALFNGRYS